MESSRNSYTGSDSVVTLELRQRLRELADMLNSVHDEKSANLLNNYLFGRLVQRITEELSRGDVNTALSYHENDQWREHTTFVGTTESSTQDLMAEIQSEFGTKHRHSALVMSVLNILRVH